MGADFSQGVDPQKNLKKSEKQESDWKLNGNEGSRSVRKSIQRPFYSWRDSLLSLGLIKRHGNIHNLEYFLPFPSHIWQMCKSLLRSSKPISIIIPCWNDGDRMDALLRAIGGHDAVREIVIVEAHPNGFVESLARHWGARHLSCPVPSRGLQMNMGAGCASGEILLFHHADTLLTFAHLDALAQASKEEDWVGGAFCRKFDHRHPYLRFLEGVDCFRSRYLGPIFGDQSIFVRRRIFESRRGFADIPLMEDVEFTGWLRKRGPLRILHPAIATSARRFERLGAWRATAINAMLIGLYYCGLSPKRLHSIYYADRREK